MSEIPTSTPFTEPMVFLRVGWMKRYEGITARDQITGGHSFIKEHGFGHEIFNFKPFEGRVYGYVQPPSKHQQWSDSKFKLERLGASSNQESITGILAIWIATAPSRELKIIGWYRNATLYRNRQPAPSGSARRYKDNECGYFLSTRQEDAVLLPTDERLFTIPKGKGGVGQANLWYAQHHFEFQKEVLQFIAARALTSARVNWNASLHQPDPFLRQEVEKAAVTMVCEHYTKYGYTVRSVEKDNVGWDLDVTHGKTELKVEVKGLSGMNASVELTPNEFVAMRHHKESYRLCIVTDALGNPRLRIFEFAPESSQWETSEGEVLKIAESISARCTLA
jgi:hypothetical protein